MKKTLLLLILTATSLLAYHPTPEETKLITIKLCNAFGYTAETEHKALATMTQVIYGRTNPFLQEQLADYIARIIRQSECDNYELSIRQEEELINELKNKFASFTPKLPQTPREFKFKIEKQSVLILFYTTLCVCTAAYVIPLLYRMLEDNEKFKEYADRLSKMNGYITEQNKRREAFEKGIDGKYEALKKGVDGKLNDMHKTITIAKLDKGDADTLHRELASCQKATDSLRKTVQEEVPKYFADEAARQSS